jgi:hypothetical protein
MSEQNILARLEKLEQFKKDTIEDINDLDNKLDYMTNDLDTLMQEKTEKVFKARTMFTEELKDQIVKEFLETHLNISQEYIDEIRGMPVVKRQDFQLENLDNLQEIYWACKILLEYTEVLEYTEKPASKEWKV